MIRQSKQPGGFPSNRSGASNVEILSRKIEPIDKDNEKVLLYGFVENDHAQVAGFALFCTVCWLEDEMSFDSEGKRVDRYFEELIRKHIDSHVVISDAVFELTFSDPELGGPVGHGSGYIRFPGGFQN